MSTILHKLVNEGVKFRVIKNPQNAVNIKCDTLRLSPTVFQAQILKFILKLVVLYNIKLFPPPTRSP